jgi:hypothetical protein
VTCHSVKLTAFLWLVIQRGPFIFMIFSG